MICACVHAQRHASQFLAVQYRCAPVLDCHVEIAFKSSIEAAVSGGAIFDFDSIISPIFNLVRYTPRNENFVLVLEGISRAKPLAS
jgi:hypothetical protein